MKSISVIVLSLKSIFQEKNLKINNKRKSVIFAFQKQICLLVLPASKSSKTGRLDLLLLQFAYYLSTLKTDLWKQKELVCRNQIRDIIVKLKSAVQR